MKRLAVIGYPIGHSLSPAMHNAAIEHLKLEIIYSRIEIKDIPELKKFTESARSEYLGFNVTVPHKSNILRFLDHVSPEVDLSGSANSVINREGELYGESTDGYGFVMALKQEFGVEVKGRKFLFIGCGGAAQAVSAYLLSEGADSILFANRTAEKAEQYASRLKKYYRGSYISFCSLIDTNAINNYLSDGSIIVQSTSLGLKAGDAIPFDVRPVTSNVIIFDMIYRQTPFIKIAADAGFKCSDGRNMLLYQGAKAFTLWTGLEAPVEIMRKALFDAMGIACS